MDDNIEEIWERDDIVRAREIVQTYKMHLFLALISIFMFITRATGFENFIKDGEVTFLGTDAWYHYRNVQYTINNWPFTMDFDPWTGYPEGVIVGQFGTLFDQIIATVALIIGLGDPSQTTARLVLLFSPAVFGALTVIPVYFIGKHLYSKRNGLFAAFLLSLLPGTFFFRGWVGLADHNSAEPLFMAVAVASIIIALKVSMDELPVIDLIKNGDYSEVSRTVKASAIAGFAMAMYMWLWPPGVLIIGILGLFTLVYTAWIAYYFDNKSPEHVLISISVMSFVSFVFMLIPIQVYDVSAFRLSLTQPLLSLALSITALVLIGVQRIKEDKNLPSYTLPAFIFTGVFLTFGVLRFAFESLYYFLVINLRRVFSLGFATNTSSTIREAMPWLATGENAVSLVLGEYGLLFGAAIIGIVLLLYNDGIRRGKPESLFTSIWGIMMAMAAFTQVRFNYYFALVVVVFSAYTLIKMLSLLDVFEDFPNIEIYQAVAVLIVFVLLLPGLLIPVAGSTTVIGAGINGHSGPDTYEGWEGSLKWLSDETPDEGTLEGADNQMEYYGQYDIPKDRNYNYPEGSYGVMAWWDYGHWITVTGKRIPVANPFQQHARQAAEFLLADSEEEAKDVIKEDLKSERDVRYVMVDWQMIERNSKLSAPVQFHRGLKQRDITQPVFIQSQQSGQVRYVMSMKKQRYYESMMVRMYLYHGSARPDPNIVVQYRTANVQTADGPTTIRVAPTDGSFVKRTRNPQSAEAIANNRTGVTTGGVGMYPKEQVEALEHYRLVKASERQATDSRSYSLLLQRKMALTGLTEDEINPHPAWVKTFEHVPGANVSGTGPANSTVVASVEMRMPSTGETFDYVQTAETGPNGQFNMTLPYSSTGYEEYGPENGYTNVSVRATGKYTFRSVNRVNTSGGNTTIQVWEAKKHIHEGYVVGDKEGTLTVELEEQN